MVTHRTLSDEADYIAYAQEVWGLDYMAIGSMDEYTWTVQQGEEGRTIVTGEVPGQEETTGLELETDGNGWIHRMQNMGTGEQDLEVFYADNWSASELDNKPNFCVEFMEKLNPGNEKAEQMRANSNPEVGLYHPGFGGFGVAGDNYFLLYYSDPIWSEEERVSRIKFVYQITSNMSIYIPSDDEIMQGFNGVDIISQDGVYVWGNSPGQGSDSGGGNIQPVNINTASVDELKALPGIGEVTAKAIADYRKTKPFKSIEDIKNVTGIGESKYKRIKDYICV